MTMPNFLHHDGDALLLYAAGHVSPELRAAIDRHIAECATCRRELDLWRSLPTALAALNSDPLPILTTDAIWSNIAPRLPTTSPMNGRTTFMSFTSDTPSQPPAPSQPVRIMRSNIWAAVAVVLAVVVLMGGFFTVFKSRNMSSSVGSRPTAIVPTATATVAASPNMVTQSDAEALFGGFLPACDYLAAYASLVKGVPCAKLDRGRIYDVNGHYCVDDWHLVSSQLVDFKANVQQYMPQQSIDGVILQTTRTDIKLIDPTFSQQYYSGQYFYIQIGMVLPPGQIAVGAHSLRQFAAGSFSFDRQIPFTIDASGTGVCR